MVVLSITLAIGFGVSWYLQHQRLATVRELSRKLTEQHERWSRDNAMNEQRLADFRQRFSMCGFHYHTVFSVCLDCKRERGDA